MASAPDHKTVRLWNARTGKPLGNPLTGHTNRIQSIAFSLDCKVLASASIDKTIRLWDVQTGALMGNPLTDDKSVVYSVAFSPDGKLLASGLGDRTVRLWDVHSGTPLADHLIVSRFPIESVTFSSDGNVLAYRSMDEVRLWDIKTSALLVDPRLTSHSRGSAVQPWDPLPHQMRDFLIGFAPRWVQFKSNWLIWNSRRLMWLPADSWGECPSALMFPFQSLAITAHENLSILDISRSLNL